MVIRSGRRGKFLACSDYPNCKTTSSIDGEGGYFQAVKTSRPCDKCGKMLVLRQSKKGYFLGCSGYPKCRNIVTITQEEVDQIKPQKK